MSRSLLQAAATPPCTESVCTCASHAVMCVCMRHVLLQWIRGILSVQGDRSQKQEEYKLVTQSTPHLMVMGRAVPAQEKPRIGSLCVE